MIKSVLLAAAAVACFATASAQAQDRTHRVTRGYERPLTVTKRSWLDVGNVVPVGTGNAYLAQSTYLNQPIYTSFAPDRFGQSTLPGQFDLAFSNENPRGPSNGGIFFDQLP